MKKLMTVAALLMLAACEQAPGITRTDAGRSDGATVDLIAVAPDGTKLWRFNNPQGHDVYFASTGTGQVVRCGKHCRRMEHVPTSTGKPQ